MRRKRRRGKKQNEGLRRVEGACEWEQWNKGDDGTWDVVIEKGKMGKKKDNISYPLTPPPPPPPNSPSGKFTECHLPTEPCQGDRFLLLPC